MVTGKRARSAEFRWGSGREAPLHSHGHSEGPISLRRSNSKVRRGRFYQPPVIAANVRSRREGVIHKEPGPGRPSWKLFERRRVALSGLLRVRLDRERQYTAPLAMIGQTCSTRLPRPQIYQS